MQAITLTITFKGATGGTVSVRILGPNIDFNYVVEPGDPKLTREFDLHPAVYSARVHGISGGQVQLTIKQGTTTLVNETSEPSNIYIVKAFAVNSPL